MKKRKILCPTLLISGSGDFHKEFSNVVISFESEEEIADVYRRLRMCEVVKLLDFGLKPFEAESPAVIQSEFPLALKCIDKTEWVLSRR